MSLTASFGIDAVEKKTRLAVIRDRPVLVGPAQCRLQAMSAAFCGVFPVLAAVILGRQASFGVLEFWQQFIEGALSPFNHAQVLLIHLGCYLGGLNDVSIFATVSFGVAALNLLPLPLLNGGNAIMYFVSSTLCPTRAVKSGFFRQVS